MKVPIFPERKVIIFTNYRSGSTTFFTEYGHANKIFVNNMLGEYFGYSHWRKIDVPFEKTFNNFVTYDKFCLKFMGHHARFDDDQIEKVLSRGDKIIYLYRKNFAKQALSFIAARRTDSFSAGVSPGTTGTTVHVPHVTSEFVHVSVDILKRNYEAMAKFYKKYPGPVYCFEDLGSSNPYKREIIWNNKPEIEDYNVEELFESYGLVKTMV